MSEDTFVKAKNGYFYFGNTPDERWIASESEGVTYNYLVYTCPTMKQAMRQLRAIRKAAEQVQREEAEQIRKEARKRTCIPCSGVGVIETDHGGHCVVTRDTCKNCQGTGRA